MTTPGAPTGTGRGSLFASRKRRVRMPLDGGHMDVSLSPDASPETVAALQAVGQAAVNRMLRALPSQDASDYYDLSAYEQAMDEWITLFASRDELAQEYATCLRDFPADWDRWPDFNAAILRRWSPAGLEYIKRQAWEIARFTG